MPTYVYRCELCGREAEVTHGINEQPSVSCEYPVGIHPQEQCGGDMKKLLSAVPFNFKKGK